MLKKLSLRIKITAITTVIMILITVILTIVSVFNANYGIYSVMTAKDEGSYINDIPGEYQKEDRNEGNEVIEKSYGIPNIYAKSYNHNQDPKDNIAVDNAMYLVKVNAISYMLVIIVIGSIFIYLVLGRVLKPVKKLAVQVGIINEHRLSQGIVGFNSGDEVSELADSFNIMIERLDKAFENQKRFSADAAHELKTPLTALKTNLDILEMEDRPSEEEYKRIINIVRKQTERMINLVNNLFVLEAQKGYEFNDSIDVPIIIEDILNDVDMDIKAKNLSVYFNKSKVFIVGNNTMITHAVSNIIQNAVKYNNDSGSIFISVEEKKSDCIIRVRDTGIGIPNDKVKNIFDPFYRAEESRSRKVGGAGLGLAITKDVVNKHGGRIRYFPNEEGGSIFEIVLPLYR